MKDIIPDHGAWRGLLRRIAAATHASDPEDLLQAAFVKLAERADRGAVHNPSGYLVRMAINLAHDERRHPASKGHIRVDDAPFLVLRSEEPLQDEVFIARERLAATRRALGKLKPQTREVFLMHRVDNLKQREISDQLQMSISAVEKHVARAAGALAECAGGR